MKMAMEARPAVVLDCGTSFCRAGYSNDVKESPRVVVPNIICTLNSESSNVSKKCFIGELASPTNGEQVHIKYPIEYGHVTNWDEMQLMWQTLTNEKLRICATDHPFILVQPPNVSAYNLEKTAEIFFENFDVPHLCLMPSGVLSLLASSIVTGIAVEIGGGACFCVPVLQGYGLRHLRQRTEFSGRDLTATLSKMIAKNADPKMEKAIPFDVANTIKEKFCYCVENYEEECSLYSKEKEIVHHFSDVNGETKTVKIGMEQFQCPESLFKPELAQKEFPGLHDIVLKCLKIEDDCIKNELASNILLCGGSSFFPGLAPRLQHELDILTMAQGPVNVSVSPFQHAAFQGGKIAANSADFLNKSMSKESYEEIGPYGITKLFIR